MKKIKYVLRLEEKGITPFGRFDKRWQKLRFAMFKKHGQKCMCCGSTERIEVDHIKPKSKYPKRAYDFSNMQLLCRVCNQRKSNVRETDYRARYEQEQYELSMLGLDFI